MSCSKPISCVVTCWTAVDKVSIAYWRASSVWPYSCKCLVSSTALVVRFWIGDIRFSTFPWQVAENNKNSDNSFNSTSLYKRSFDRSELLNICQLQEPLSPFKTALIRTPFNRMSTSLTDVLTIVPGNPILCFCWSTMKWFQNTR